jgi:hypothetical protein
MIDISPTCGRPLGDNQLKVIYLYRPCSKMRIIGFKTYSERPKKAPQDPGLSYDLTERGNKEMNVTTMTSYKATDLTF